MNISKFTQKSQEVVQNCEKVAMDYGHQEIAQPHLLASMMSVEDSLIRKLIEKMGIEPDVFMAQVDGLLAKRPKVSGGQLHIDQYLNQTLIYAEDEAKHMGDEYVSVEHLFLSLLVLLWNSRRLQGKGSCRHYPRSGATRGLQVTIQKLLMIHWRNMVQTLLKGLKTGKWTLLLAGTVKSVIL